MRTYIILIISLISLKSSAQNQWTYDMYKQLDFSNFRTNALFTASYDSEHPDIPLLDAALFFALNEQRAKHGKSILKYHPACEIAAYNHSKEMAENNFLSHQNPKSKSRRTTSDRGKLAGIANPIFAENIAYNYGEKYDSYLQIADMLTKQWMNSSGHRDNILSEKALQAGCGVYIIGDKVYGTQVFQWYDYIKTQKAKDELPRLKDGSKADISSYSEN